MNSINILCCGLSKVLYDIVEDSFRRRESLRILGNYPSLNMFQFADKEQPDVIIMESRRSDRCPDVLYEYPRAKVVSIEQHGKCITVWQLLPGQQNLGELSSDELANVILSFTTETH